MAEGKELRQDGLPAEEITQAAEEITAAMEQERPARGAQNDRSRGKRHMAEGKELRQDGLPAEEITQAAEEITAAMEQELAAPAPENMPAAAEEGPKKKGPKKKKHLVRNIILIVIAALVLALIVWGCMKFFGGGSNKGDVMTAMVDVGSITSTVSGEGLTRAKDSANMTLTTAGTVQEIFVKEGDHVEAGQQLYKIKSDAAEDAVRTAQKDSANMTLTTAGTVQEIFVKEGDHVEAGQQLYKIKSDAAEDAVRTAQKELEDCGKELKKLQENRANLTVRAPHGGKVLFPEGVQKVKLGDNLGSGTHVATVVDDSKMKLRQYYSYAYAKQIKVGQSADISIPSAMATHVATVVDDSKMKLRQYYSYAYAKQIKVGQSADISIPSAMASVKGTVSEIHMVERISAEGSKLFEVDFIMSNPGTLAAGADASATLQVGGETVYPYESAKLEYNQSTDVVTKVGGPVEKVNLREYAKVGAGDVLVVMGGDENDTAVFDMENRIKTAQKNLEEAQKALDLLNGVSPIAGTVMSISMEPGAEVASGTTVMVVSDTAVIQLDANVDERSISNVQEGMSVEVNQNENVFMGTVTSVSLTSKAENGVATFPVVISIDNTDGSVLAGSYAQYSMVTSQMGTVTSVSLTSKAENGVATFPVVISIDNTDGSVLAGSYAQYSMVTSQSNDCLILPIPAVKSVETAEGSMSVVYVHADERPENAVDVEIPPEGVPETGYWAVPVTTGIFDAQNIEIIDGVEAGTEVFQQVMYSEMY